MLHVDREACSLLLFNGVGVLRLAVQHSRSVKVVERILALARLPLFLLVAIDRTADSRAEQWEKHVDQHLQVEMHPIN